MFLKSDAYRAIEREQPSFCDWRGTNILMIVYEWDDVRGGPEALASLRLAARLRDAGARIHVLTAVGEQRWQSKWDVTVVPTAPLAPQRLIRAWQMIRTGIPESECLWVRGAVRAGMGVLSSLPTDTLIYGRAMPGASNIIAWHLAKLTGLPWVAHFSDEWPPVQALSRGRAWLAPYKAPLFQFWRHRILRDAGALTFTNPRQAATVLGNTGRRYRSKAFVVTHLGSESRVRSRPQQYESFHIVHTGNLNPPGHTSEPLMRGLRIFLDRTPAAKGTVRLTQAGWSNGDMPEWTKRYDLDDVVRMVGRLPQAEVAQLIDDASLLVGFDYTRSDSATLLSKLPDYVSARRPILVITAPGSAMGGLFREDGVGLTAHYDSPTEVAECLSSVFAAWQSRSDSFLARNTAVASFSSRCVLAELAAACTVARRARHATSEKSRPPARLGEERSQ